jgi:hypothetical protein
MRYQDGFDGQRPPWEDADYSGYRDDAFRAPAQAAPAQSRADEFQGDEFQPWRGEYQPGHGDYETRTDGIPAIGRTGASAFGGQRYGAAEDPAYQAGYALATPAGHRRGGRRRSRGLLAGGITGFLAAGTALGVANLVAAFVRPQASPIIAVGGAFIDRTPPALKNFAVEKFGENDKNMLLLGMYVTIALIAMVIGMIAWRHLWVGVAGISLFGLFGAFVAYTRPESHATDAVPALVGGLVGIMAIVWLNQWTLQREPDTTFAPPLPQRTPRTSGWAA